jgi:hypothetical protein
MKGRLEREREREKPVIDRKSGSKIKEMSERKRS